MAPGRRRLTGVLAVAGVVVAHTVDYALVHPDSALRGHHLLVTGHGYWPAAVVVGGLASVLAVFAAVFGGAVRGALGGLARERPTPGAPSLARLAAVQVVLFTVVEGLEHALTGRSLAELAGTPELLLGLPLQVVVAAGVLAVLVLLERLTERVTSRLRVPVGVFPRPAQQLRRDRWRLPTVPVGAPRSRGLRAPVSDPLTKAR